MNRIEARVATVQVQAPVIVAPEVEIAAPVLVLPLDSMERGTTKAQESLLPPASDSGNATLTTLAAQVESGPLPPASTPLAPAAAIDERLLQDRVPDMPVLYTGLARLVRDRHPVMEKIEKAINAGALTPTPTQPLLSPKTVTELAAWATSPKRGAIQIPGPAVLAAERELGGLDLSKMDVESAVMIVMGQLGEEADRDLRDMIGQMDAGRRKRDVMRLELQALKQRQSHAPSARKPEVETEQTQTTAAPESVDATEGVQPATEPQPTELQDIYDALPSSLGNPMPSLEVFLTDASWLQQALPDVQISIDPAHFQEQLLAVIKSEILNPVAFRHHVEAAFKKELALDFFLNAEHGREDARETLQAEHDKAATTLSRLAGAGEELFGSEFTQALAASKVAIFQDFTEEAHELMRDGRHHGDEIGEGIVHRIKETLHEQQGIALVGVGAVLLAPMTAGASLVVGAGVAAGAFVMSDTFSDKSMLGSLADSELATNFVYAAAECGLSEREINDMLNVGMRDEDDANAFLRQESDALDAQLREANALEPFKGTAASLKQERPFGRATNRAAESEAGASAEATETKEDLQLLIDEKRNEMDAQKDITDAMQLRLQLYMERKSKIATTLSNIMKKFSDTKDLIVGNTK